MRPGSYKVRGETLEGHGVDGDRAVEVPTPFDDGFRYGGGWAIKDHDVRWKVRSGVCGFWLGSIHAERRYVQGVPSSEEFFRQVHVPPNSLVLRAATWEVEENLRKMLVVMLEVVVLRRAHPFNPPFRVGALD